MCGSPREMEVRLQCRVGIYTGTPGEADISAAFAVRTRSSNHSPGGCRSTRPTLRGYLTLLGAAHVGLSAPFGLLLILLVALASVACADTPPFSNGDQLCDALRAEDQDFPDSPRDQLVVCEWDADLASNCGQLITLQASTDAVNAVCDRCTRSGNECEFRPLTCEQDAVSPEDLSWVQCLPTGWR